MKRIRRHMTTLVFAACTSVSLASVGLVLWLGLNLLVLVVVSLLLNIWALVVSERQGFIRSNQIRRAFEPQRHFNAAQVFILIVLIMAQIGAATYVAIAASA